MGGKKNIGSKKNYKIDITKFVLTLVISLATIGVSMIQLNVSNNEYKINQANAQPLFSVSTGYGEEMEDGKIRDLNLYITNKGNSFYDFSSQQICFLKISYDGDERYLPLNYFFSKSQEVYGGDNNIVYLSEGYRNNFILYNVNTELREKLLEERGKFTSIERVIFTKVIYQDIFGDYHTKYFESTKGKMLNEVEGNRIFSVHREFVDKLSFLTRDMNDYPNIDNLNVDYLVTYIESDVKLTSDTLFPDDE